MSQPKPDKTLKVGGNAHVAVEGDKLTVTPSGGLIALTVADLDGIVMWMHHPLSGWYIECDMRKSTTTESE
jgi:hypothetical protein